MATPAIQKPLLNIGKISDGRYKFSLSTDDGTFFCEVSVGKTLESSDDQKKSEAILKVKRMIEDLGKALSIL